MADNQGYVPRVLKSNMNNYMGQTVRFVGRLINHDKQQNVAYLQGADNQALKVYLSKPISPEVHFSGKT